MGKISVTAEIEDMMEIGGTCVEINSEGKKVAQLFDWVQQHVDGTWWFRNMLGIVLNVNRRLADNWHLDYGITRARNRTFLAPYPERNSFKHPRSETALSLFMLGNIDAWKQLGARSSPRNDTGTWSQSFFETLRELGDSNQNPQTTRWPLLNHGLFQDATLNWESARLMFEFEVMNSAFHSVDGQPFSRSRNFLFLISGTIESGDRLTG